MVSKILTGITLICLFRVCDLAAAPSDVVGRFGKQLHLELCTGPWADDSILCGKYEVYENRALATGRKIALHVIVIPARTDNPEPDPIFYFEGGPGVPATDAAHFFAQESAFRDRRDIVLVDTRGTGDSNPLHCNLVGDSTVLQNFVNEMYPPQLVEECRRELEKHSDLSQYTTLNAMADIDEVRAALGYESINILGISYGGRAAFVYARAFPERVRSIALFGPADIESKMPLYHAHEAEEAFDSLFVDCRRDSACNTTFPSLEQELRALVTRLRNETVNTGYEDPRTKRLQTVTIRADVLVEALRTALYSSFGARQVPWIVHQATIGNFEPLLDRKIPTEFDYPPFLAEGAYLSITGAEDAPFISVTEADSLTAGTLLGDYRVVQQRRAAAIWPKASLPEDYFSDLSVEVPTLIFQGGRDPVIGCHKAIKYFANGREIVIPQMSHISSGLSNEECLDEIVLKFYETLDLQQIDTSCIRTMIPPPFKVSEVTK